MKCRTYDLLFIFLFLQEIIVVACMDQHAGSGHPRSWVRYPDGAEVVLVRPLEKELHSGGDAPDQNARPPEANKSPGMLQGARCTL